MLMRFLPVFLVISCGADDDAASPESPVVAPEQVKVSAAPSEDEAMPTTAMLVPTAARLPACGEASGALYYVRDEAAFYVCGEGWETIDLRGPKGEDGQDGANGADGIDGTNGVDGVDGSDGVDAPVLSATEWIDPITRSTWMAATTGSWTTAKIACTGAYRLPSEDELLAAALHGLLDGLGGNANAWLGGDSGNDWTWTVYIGPNPAPSTRLKTDVIGIYCIKEAAL